MIDEGKYASAATDSRLVMSDTVKIERPLCCRRHEDLGGRVKKDSQGNPIKARTRVRDSQDDVARPWLELDEGRHDTTG